MYLGTGRMLVRQTELMGPAPRANRRVATRDWQATMNSYLRQMCAGVADSRGEHGRAIGPIGTAARVIVGAVLVAILFTGRFQPAAWVLGLVGFPAVLLIWQWLRARRNPARFEAIGPVGFLVNIAVFLALFLTPWYLPALAVTSNATQLFYGASMLLAAARGYAGCEVLAVSNWILRRDDQIGCLLFEPVDRLERARAQR